MSYSAKNLTISGKVNSLFGGDPNTYDVWTTAGSGITISNGGLTLTRTGNASAKGGQGKSSGKWYYETLIVVDGDFMIGVGNAAAQLDQFAGQNTNSSGYRGNGTVTNPALSSLATYTTGDYIGVGVDFDAGLIRYYKNGTLITSPTIASTGISGALFPFISLWSSGSSQVTSNFGASSFPYGVPSGFNPGWYI